MKSERRHVRELRRIGGALCLDFVNTVDPRFGAGREEFLDGYGALVEWAVHAGAISRATGRELRRRGEASPRRAERVLARAIALREALYAVFADRRPDALAVVTEEVRRALAHAGLERDRAGYRLAFAAAGDELDRVLWPVARSALELLTSPELARVRECSGDDCGWLFVDRSKAGRRRWCSMESCGNRAKVRRHRAGRRVGA